MQLLNMLVSSCFGGHREAKSTPMPTTPFDEKWPNHENETLNPYSYPHLRGVPNTREAQYQGGDLPRAFRRGEGGTIFYQICFRFIDLCVSFMGGRGNGQ